MEEFHRVTINPRVGEILNRRIGVIAIRIEIVQRRIVPELEDSAVLTVLSNNSRGQAVLDDNVTG